MRMFINHKPRPSWSEDQVLQLHQLLGEHYSRLRGPVSLRLRFVFEHLDPRGSTPVTEASLPALVRGTLDQLCGLAWENEKQLVQITAQKEYGNTNGIQVIY